MTAGQFSTYLLVIVRAVDWESRENEDKSHQSRTLEILKDKTLKSGDTRQYCHEIMERALLDEVGCSRMAS